MQTNRIVSSFINRKTICALKNARWYIIHKHVYFLWHEWKLLWIKKKWTFSIVFIYLIALTINLSFLIAYAFVNSELRFEPNFMGECRKFLRPIIYTVAIDGDVINKKKRCSLSPRNIYWIIESSWNGYRQFDIVSERSNEWTRERGRRRWSQKERKKANSSSKSEMRKKKYRYY